MTNATIGVFAGLLALEPFHESCSLSSISFLQFKKALIYRSFLSRKKQNTFNKLSKLVASLHD